MGVQCTTPLTPGRSVSRQTIKEEGAKTNRESPSGRNRQREKGNERNKIDRKRQRLVPFLLRGWRGGRREGRGLFSQLKG